MSLRDKIAAAKEQVTDLRKDSVPVVHNGVAFQVEVTQLEPLAWETLVSKNPPRKTSVTDHNIGYNQSSLPAQYPVEAIRVDGELMTVEDWQDFYGMLDSVHRTNIGTVVWGVNVFSAIQELAELGKALMGGSKQ